MKWHCGILSDDPRKDRTFQWLTRGYWDTGMPPEIERELRIWMAMPGFSISYHSRVFGLSPATMAKHIGGYEKYKDEVHENWLSATREDCLKLCLRRRGGNIPVISQLQMLNDLKTGYSKVGLSREYRVSLATVHHIGRGWIRGHSELPVGFSLLGATPVRQS